MHLSLGFSAILRLLLLGAVVVNGVLPAVGAPIPSERSSATSVYAQASDPRAPSVPPSHHSRHRSQRSLLSEAKTNEVSGWATEVAAQSDTSGKRSGSDAGLSVSGSRTAETVSAKSNSSRQSGRPRSSASGRPTPSRAESLPPASTLRPDADAQSVQTTLSKHSGSSAGSSAITAQPPSRAPSRSSARSNRSRASTTPGPLLPIPEDTGGGASRAGSRQHTQSNLGSERAPSYTSGAPPLAPQIRRMGSNEELPAGANVIKLSKGNWFATVRNPSGIASASLPPGNYMVKHAERLCLEKTGCS